MKFGEIHEEPFIRGMILMGRLCKKDKNSINHYHGINIYIK